MATIPKTWLTVKEEVFSLAQTVFEGIGVSITLEGKRHLGAAIAFIKAYVQENVATWIAEVDRLTKVAETLHMPPLPMNYLSRTISDTGNLFQPLEDVVWISTNSHRSVTKSVT